MIYLPESATKLWVGKSLNQVTQRPKATQNSLIVNVALTNADELMPFVCLSPNRLLARFYVNK